MTNLLVADALADRDGEWRSDYCPGGIPGMECNRQEKVMNIEFDPDNDCAIDEAAAEVPRSCPEHFAVTDELWGCVWGDPDPLGDYVVPCGTFKDAVERAVENAEDETDAEVTEVKVAAWRRPAVPPSFLRGSVLEHALERLDEEFGDPDGDDTEPTAEMRAVEKKFIDDLLALYKPEILEAVEIVRVDVAEWRALRGGK